MSDSDIVQDFLVESYENLDRLDRELVGLEKNPHDREALGSVFRTIHTIKGTCGFLGFNKLEKVAHVGENLLTRLRDGQLTLNPDLTTALLGMVDAVRQMLKEIQSTGQDGENDYPELRETLTRLQQVGTGAVKQAGTTKSPGQAKVPADLPGKEPGKEMTAIRSNDNALPQAAKAAGTKAKPTEAPAVRLEPARGTDRGTPAEAVAGHAEEPAVARPDDIPAAQPSPESRPRDAAAETIRVDVHLAGQADEPGRRAGAGAQPVAADSRTRWRTLVCRRSPNA